MIFTVSAVFSGSVTGSRGCGVGLGVGFTGSTTGDSSTTSSNFSALSKSLILASNSSTFFSISSLDDSLFLKPI